MRTEDKILKILKQHTNGIMAEELYEELSTPIPDEEVHSACAFLKKYGLITVGYGGESAKITSMGLQLLNLPDLPEDETIQITGILDIQNCLTKNGYTKNTG